MKTADLPLGSSLGHQTVPDALSRRIEHFAGEIYRSLEAEEFSGDPVQTHAWPDTWPRADQFVQGAALERWHLAPVADPVRWQLVSTASVDAHVDTHGPTLLWTLFNDGLKLKIGRRSWTPPVGELILFDDTRPHEVLSPKGKGTVLVLFSVPLRFF